jgi:hypothetical protein
MAHHEKMVVSINAMSDRISESSDTATDQFTTSGAHIRRCCGDREERDAQRKIGGERLSLVQRKEGII